MFKKNCGFLSEEQQERWSREFTHTGKLDEAFLARVADPEGVDPDPTL